MTDTADVRDVHVISYPKASKVYASQQLLLELSQRTLVFPRSSLLNNTVHI